jgi:hypothetical protein
LDGDIVGYMFFTIDKQESAAHLEFPRMMPGHEQAAVFLMENALQRLKDRGVSNVTGRLTIMAPCDIQLAEKVGFEIRDWGYKTYFDYQMDSGHLDISDKAAEEIDPEHDLTDRHSTSYCISI